MLLETSVLLRLFNFSIILASRNRSLGSYITTHTLYIAMHVAMYGTNNGSLYVVMRIVYFMVSQLHAC